MKKVKCPRCDFCFHPEKPVNMTDLARAANRAINKVVTDTDTRFRWDEYFYINKTRKYISIKFPEIWLRTDEREKVAQLLRKQYPNRYLHIANGTARSWKHGVLVKEDKVMVRFTQK